MIGVPAVEPTGLCGRREPEAAVPRQFACLLTRSMLTSLPPTPPLQPILFADWTVVATNPTRTATFLVFMYFLIITILVLAFCCGLRQTYGFFFFKQIWAQQLTAVEPENRTVMASMSVCN